MRKWDKWESVQNSTEKYANLLHYVISYKMIDGIMGKGVKLYEFLYV
jgi:hypothetical protein